MQLLKQRNASFSYFLILLISKYKIMKRIYICPSMLAVSLHASATIASSFGEDVAHISLSDNENDVVSSPSGVFTKENKSLWDNEW